MEQETYQHQVLQRLNRSGEQQIVHVQMVEQSPVWQGPQKAVGRWLIAIGRRMLGSEAQSFTREGSLPP